MRARKLDKMIGMPNMAMTKNGCNTVDGRNSVPVEVGS